MTTKLEQNRIYAAKLGWTPKDFGVNDFTQGIVDAITATQKDLGLAGVDGVAGPVTYCAVLARRQSDLKAKSKTFDPTTNGDQILSTAGAIAVLQLQMAWMRDGGVIDLPAKTSANYGHSQKFIDAIIRTSSGINWTWEDPYQADTLGHGTFEWCGAAAAFGWREAGLKQTIAKDYFASTYRLDRFARYKQINEHTPNPWPTVNGLKPWNLRVLMELDSWSTPEQIAAFGVRAGDILLVGPAKSAYGKHVTVVEKFDSISGFFFTIEGNGNGFGPDGIRRQGVVRAQRPLGLRPGMLPTVYHARRLIRVALSDLV